MTRPQVASRSEVARGLRASVCAATPRRGSLLYKKETSRRGLFEKAAWAVTAALALSCSAVAADACCGGGVWYELPAENAGGFAVLRPIALADAPVKSLRGTRGLVYLNEKPMPIDGLWSNGTAPAAYWLWEKHGFSNCKTQ